MSAKAMGQVWELDLPQRDLLVLLALADHADHFGGNIFPSLGLIAWKTGVSERTVQRSVKKLVKMGALVSQPRLGKTTVYRMQLENCPRKQPYQPEHPGHSYVTPDKLSPLTGQPNEVMATPDTAVSPEPSIDNHQTTTTAVAVAKLESPELERPNAFTMYERQFGMLLSPGIVDRLRDMVSEYGEEWVNDALGITATSGKRGNLRYTEGILRKWKADGKNDDRSKSNPVVDELTAWRAAQKARPNVLLDAALDMVLPAFKDEDDRRRYIEDYLQIDYTPLMSKESAS